MEIAFKLLVMVAQLSAVCAVGAFIADHIIEPKRRSRHHMGLIDLLNLRRKGRALLSEYHCLSRRGKHLSAYEIACRYNNAAHRYNLNKPRWLPAMTALTLEVRT